jgi:hypothetical protein
MMGDHARGHRLHVVAIVSFIAPWHNNREGKVAAPPRHCKKAQ